jgi:hypothetical protein
MICQSVAWYFYFFLKEPWPFKFKETFFSGLINFLGGVLGKCGVPCKFNDKTAPQPEINMFSAII